MFLSVVFGGHAARAGNTPRALCGAGQEGRARAAGRVAQGARQTYTPRPGNAYRQASLDLALLYWDSGIRWLLRKLDLWQWEGP